MNVPKRNGNKWSVNEILSLQREYELLELTVEQIAEKHERTPNSIACKLIDEGFVSLFRELRTTFAVKKM